VFSGAQANNVVVYAGDSSKNVVRRYASALSLKYEDCVALEKLIIDRFQKIQDEASAAAADAAAADAAVTDAAVTDAADASSTDASTGAADFWGRLLQLWDVTIPEQWAAFALVVSQQTSVNIPSDADTAHVAVVAAALTLAVLLRRALVKGAGDAKKMTGKKVVASKVQKTNGAPEKKTAAVEEEEDAPKTKKSVKKKKSRAKSSGRN
jgi:hypothetical protein